MKISQINLLAIAVIGLGTWMAGTAPATTIIYQDSFSRGTVGSPVALNGTSPDVVNTGAATWVAGAGATTDGTNVNDGAFTSGYLPFTPVAGNIYTLSADLNIAADGNWEALGFSAADSLAGSGMDIAHGGGAFFQVNAPAPWVLHANSGTHFDTSFTGPAVSGTITNFATNLSGQQNYEIVLNTTNPLHWTVSFERNNILQATPFTYTTNPTINFVAFGNTATAGTIDNFTLTAQAVPEPSSVVLLGGAALGLLAAVRRRRAG